MATLSKADARLHRQACELVALPRDLTEQEKDFVLDHWQASANPTNRLSGAFFTPAGLAWDLRLEVSGDRIVDLGAGIGQLAYACRDHWNRRWNNQPPRELVCVEINPDYVDVGRKIVPEATWVCADMFALSGKDLGEFDTAIANPPYGTLTRSGNGAGYAGRRFEYHVIGVAADLARRGVFLIPQTSAPFRYSGRPCCEHDTGDDEYTRFHVETGIELEPGMGVDTTYYRDQWHGVRPNVEIVTCDFTERRSATVPAARNGQQEQLSFTVS